MEHLDCLACTERPKRDSGIKKESNELYELLKVWTELSRQRKYTVKCTEMRENMAHVFIYSLIVQLFIEHLLCTSHSISRSGGTTDLSIQSMMSLQI